MMGVKLRLELVYPTVSPVFFPPTHNHRTRSKWSYSVSIEMPNCFLETTDQNHKSYSGSMCKRENFDLQLHLEQKSCPPRGNKVSGHDQILNTGTLSEVEDLLSKKIWC